MALSDVLELHSPVTEEQLDEEGVEIIDDDGQLLRAFVESDTHQACRHCWQSYPCTTVQAANK